MLSIFDGLRDLSTWNVIIRLIAAALLGTLIGLERSAKNRTAGFRTHILVCLGGAIAAVTGLYIYMVMELPADVSRISGQVITGLGFIGAGAIIVTKKMSIKGLTTAAGLWATGIVGLAIGSGFYEGGILGTALILLTQTVMAKFGSKMIKHDPQYKLEVRYEQKHALDQVLRDCKDNRLAIVNLHIQNKTGPEDPDYEAVIELRGNMRADQLIAHIKTMEGILDAYVV
ncbi:MAG: MgtC/SapB family protein [Lachnospiraceae bacterium]|nr:MgtC/SapB family protein [Lachnospiraceae bacterium]